MRKRQGFPHKIPPPHNLPFAVLGAGLLWVGWFGFNAGSALAASTSGVNAFVVTHVSSAAAGLTWAVLDVIRHKRATLLGVITGAVAGLVAITPASGSVNAMGAIGIGVGASIVGFLAVSVMKPKFGYDDSLDVFGVHGMAGIWGSIATGIWATATIPGNAVNGLLAGNPIQVVIQVKAVLYTIVWSGIVSWVLLKVIDKTIGLSVSEHGERVGLDLTDHYETAYTIME
jgi:Amt family ammonium transporter